LIFLPFSSKVEYSFLKNANNLKIVKASEDLKEILIKDNVFYLVCKSGDEFDEYFRDTYALKCKFEVKFFAEMYDGCIHILINFFIEKSVYSNENNFVNDFKESFRILI
jgi:hypothetical protein